MELKFNLNQLKDLDNDLQASQRAIPLIVTKVLKDQLQPLRQEFRQEIPRKTGALRRSFSFSVRRIQQKVVARFGFFTGKKISASASIAANVLQSLGGARPRKGKYLWIPIPGNRQASGQPVVTPRQLLALGGFVRRSKAGNMIAFQKTGQGIVPMFVLKTLVQFDQRPIAFEQRITQEAPVIAEGIEITIAQVIEARRRILEAGLGG